MLFIDQIKIRGVWFRRSDPIGREMKKKKKKKKRKGLVCE
jgi:hypothetical protein